MFEKSEVLFLKLSGYVNAFCIVKSDAITIFHLMESQTYHKTWANIVNFWF